MENWLKMIPGAYWCTDNRCVTVAKGAVKSLKYQTITDWSSAKGMTTCS